MNLRSVDLNLLTVFDAVITEGSISKAASKIGMSQPAVSLAIARFRGVVGETLFESTGRGVKPTPRALQLAGPIRRALDLVSGALQHDGAFDVVDSEKTFNLVLGDYGEAVVLPRLMEYLQESGSGIRINTLAASSLDVVSEMRFSNVDIYTWITPLDEEGFTSLQMGTINEVCLVRKDHPLVRAKPSLEQYAGLKHIVIQLPGSYGPSAIDRELWASGLKRESTMNVHSYFDVPNILSTTDMICKLPFQLAKHFSECYPLKIIPSPVETTLPIYLIWHNSMDNDPGHRWLRQHLISLYSRM